jgi:hypothetical protein
MRAKGAADAQLDRYEEAFPCFLEARRLQSKMQPYDPDRTEAQFRQIAAYWQKIDSGNAKPKYIFVMGMPRPGTTLTDQILASNSEVHSLGESGVVGALLSRLATQNNHPDCLEKLSPEQRALVKTELEASLASTSSTRILVDTSPGNFPYLGLLAELLPNAKFVHCARNPLSTCVSIIEHPLSSAHQNATKPKLMKNRIFVFRELTSYSELARLSKTIYSSRMRKGEVSRNSKMGLGIALGAGIGAAFGAATGNIGFFTALGVGLGVVLGAAMSKKATSTPDED